MYSTIRTTVGIAAAAALLAFFALETSWLVAVLLGGAMLAVYLREGRYSD
jgi:hypothetical protein